MAVYKQGRSPYYLYDFSVDGVRFRGSTQTDDLETAKSIEAKLRADVVVGKHFKRLPEITLNEACARYWMEHAVFLKSQETVKFHCRHLLRFFGAKLMLHALSSNLLAQYVASRRRRVSGSTVNREVSTLRKIINLARHVWEVRTPELAFGRHRLHEPDCRIRWLTSEQAALLVQCAAPHLKAPILFALYTGARLRNVLDCRWEQVNFKHDHITFRVKSVRPTGKTHVIPMVTPLRQLLLSMEPQKTGLIFTYRGQPIKKLRRSFKTACKLAGIDDFRFHDLRHTAASWLVQSGVAIEVVKEILGHEDIQTTLKYAHHRIDAHRDALEGAMAEICHTSTQKGSETP